MTNDDIEALAHRTCWRYRMSSDPHHSDTYKFNVSTLHDFAQKVIAAEREACAVKAGRMVNGKSIAAAIRARSNA